MPRAHERDGASLSAGHRRGHCRRDQTRRVRRGTVSVQRDRSSLLAPDGTARPPATARRNSTNSQGHNAPSGRRSLDSARTRCNTSTACDKPTVSTCHGRACDRLCSPGFGYRLARRSRRWPPTSGGTCGRRARSRRLQAFLPETTPGVISRMSGEIAPGALLLLTGRRDGFDRDCSV